MPAVKPARLRAARVATAAIFVLNGTGMGLWGAHVPILQAGLGLDGTTLGVALLTVALGAVLAMPLTGPLTARLGSRRAIMVSGLAFGVSLGLPILAPSVPILLAAALLFGAANGSMDVAMNTQASHVEQAYGRPIMSAFHACFSLGGMAGALLAAGLLRLGTPPAGHLTLLGLLVAGAVPVAGRSLLPGREAPGRAFALPSGAALQVGGLAFLTLLTEGAIMDWSAVYLTSGPTASASAAALGYAAFSVAMTLGRLAGDRVVAPLGRGRALAASAALAGTGVLLAVAGGTLAAGIAGFAVAGLGLANTVPILFSTGARLPGVAPGVGVAMVATLGYAGFLLGPPAIGAAADAWTLRVALMLTVPGVLAVTLLGPRVLARSRTTPSAIRR